MALGGLPNPHLLLPPDEDPAMPPNSGTPQDFGTHPGLEQLLRNLGQLLGREGLSPHLQRHLAQLLGREGLSPHLQRHLAQAEEGLSRARGRWLHLELLWRLLGELGRDPREMEPDVLRAVDQELTWAQVRRGPPDIARLLPPPQDPALLPRLLPELERRLREKREELQNFLLGPPKIPQNPPKIPQNPQNPGKNTGNPGKNPGNPGKMPGNSGKTAKNPAKNPPKIPQNSSEILQNSCEIPENPPKIPPNPAGIPENPGRIPQNPGKTSQNPGKTSENLGKTSQNPGKSSQDPAKIPPKIPQNSSKIPQNSSEILENSSETPQDPPEIPENSPGIPEILGLCPGIPGIPAALGRILGAERLRLRRERLRERRLRERLERINWKYPEALSRCALLLSRLRSLGALQAHLDEGRGRYLLAKGGALLLKSRLEELRILLDTYPAPTVEAHRRIRAELSEGRRSAQAEAAILGAELAALRGLGGEFRALAQELGQIRQETAQKGWALRQLRPSEP